MDLPVVWLYSSCRSNSHFIYLSRVLPCGCTDHEDLGRRPGRSPKSAIDDVTHHRAWSTKPGSYWRRHSQGLVDETRQLLTTSLAGPGRRNQAATDDVTRRAWSTKPGSYWRRHSQGLVDETRQLLTTSLAGLGQRNQAATDDVTHRAWSTILGSYWRRHSQGLVDESRQLLTTSLAGPGRRF